MATTSRSQITVGSVDLDSRVGGRSTPNVGRIDSGAPDSSRLQVELLNAARTRSYLTLSVFGVVIAALAFAPWVGAAPVGEPDMHFAVSWNGLDVGGWGIATIVLGLAIALIGCLGYWWNPLSDPEAGVIGGFAALGILGAIYKLSNVKTAAGISHDFDDSQVSVGPGLWLILAFCAASLVGAVGILLTCPRPPD